MGASMCRHAATSVRVDGHYDYVDHITRARRRLTLDQNAVHSNDVHTMKKTRRRRRGNLLKACSAPADSVAMAVVDSARHMAEVVAGETDVLDRDWQCSQGLPLEVLLGLDSDVCETLTLLAGRVRQLVEDGPTIVSVSAPTRIFGDLHGQFRDLLLWLQDFGFPHDYGPGYVFNGDWVDRGRHQLETVALVFALKVAYPSKVFLVRGNHEFRDQNMFMGPVGFWAACGILGRQSRPVFDAFHAAFDMLPLGCLLSDKVLVVHGGLGDGSWDLAQIAGVRRPITSETVSENRHVYNILWSDPIPETIEDSFGVHDSPRDGHRMLVLAFGKDITEHFCWRNKVEMVVRSHQAKKGGSGYEVMHGDRLVRVFSARDYEGHKNDGAMLKVRWSHGAKLVVRPQLLRSITKVRDPDENQGELADEPMLDSMCSFVDCTAPQERGNGKEPEEVMNVGFREDVPAFAHRESMESKDGSMAQVGSSGAGSA